MKIPEPTLKRAFLYHRSLLRLAQEGQDTTSSAHLAELLGLTAAQVRKDLAYFGQFGRRGYGYEVSRLAEKFQVLLEVNKDRNVAVIGAGKLGSALLSYRGFHEKQMHLQAAFDVDPGIVGQMIAGVRCFHIDELEQRLTAVSIDMAMLATPEGVAQGIADRLVYLDIRAILNFAPVSLSVPPKVKVINVDLATELQTLAYYLSSSINSK